MPLQRRVPKFGFNNINRKEYNGINLDVIQKLVDDKRITDSLTKEDLIKFGLAHKNDLIKILGRGELTAKLNIVADKYTKSAQDRKSTRLNSSHVAISYAVFCLKKKKTQINN